MRALRDELAALGIATGFGGLVLGDSHDEDCKGRTMLRDKLLARLREMGDAPGEMDYQRLAAEVLGRPGTAAVIGMPSRNA